MAMAAKVEWTPELVEILIESVRSHKVVWDSSSSSYKNKNALESAWIQIALDCGLEGKASYAKAKWRDLKDTYRKKLKLLTPKSGDTGGAKKVCWQWMSQMSFMRKVSIVETPTTSNFLTVEDEESNQTGELPSTCDNDISSKLDCDVLPDSPACSSSAGSVCHISTPVVPNFSGKRRKRDEAPNQVDLAILAELSRDNEDDEDSFYMKSLVPQLKRLNQQTKAFVKCQIQQLLFKAEFGINFQEQ